MKTTTVKLWLLVSLISLPCFVNAQDTLAGWTFPSGQPIDTIANYFTTLNSGKSLHTSGGVSGQITFTNGATTYAATATGWDNGMGIKCWELQISTLGYHNLSLSSKQRSGGNNPGPRDFIVQYKTGVGGTWIDVPGTTIITSGDWSAELINIPLPADCDNQNDAVSLRWIMTSNTNSLGDPVVSSGISKIDDIFITGDVLTGLPAYTTTNKISIFPNPFYNSFTIKGITEESYVRIIDLKGTVIRNSVSMMNNGNIDLGDAKEGVYFLQIFNKEGVVNTQKIIKLN